ncbi:MAG TPA: hypothetical protein ACFYD5_04410 [Candidatus Tripitaka sp. YC43]
MFFLFMLFIARPSLSAPGPEPGMVQGGGWAVTYGGVNLDGIYSIQQTVDGGYIVAGTTSSFGAGAGDVWVLKLRSDSTVEWQRSYGGDKTDIAYSICQTTDGGYIVAGVTNSFGMGSGDALVLKLRADGTLEWQKTYGGGGSDVFHSVGQTADGGYIVGGRTTSFGIGSDDFWVLKLRVDGGVEWQKTYGGIDWDEASSICQAGDGGYVVAGRTLSFGPLPEKRYYMKYSDVWLLKLRSDGAVEWQKAYGGGDCDYALSVLQTSDGGYVVGGVTESFGAGASDFWILKLRSDGTVEWQKTYGGRDNDHGGPVRQTSDGGYLVAGATRSFGAGALDSWVLKLRPDGTVEWQKTYGGDYDDAGCSIQQTGDGGYIVAGNTESFGAGRVDAWVLKLRPDGSINPSCGFGRDTSVSGKDSNAKVEATDAIAIDSGTDPQEPAFRSQTIIDILINGICP